MQKIFNRNDSKQQLDLTPISTSQKAHSRANFTPSPHPKGTRPLLLLLCLLLLAGCWQPSLPDWMPKEWGDLPNLSQELGLPDWASLGDIPGLDQLPQLLNPPPGTIRYNGPIERSIAIGDRVPGTDMVLTALADGVASFQIAGLHSERRVGDSLDYDGKWPQVPDIDYSLRLRIYRVTNDSIRAAGVHQLVIPNIQPTISPPGMQLGGFKMKFPFTVNISNGQNMAGTTLGYAGSDERGGIISGLAVGEYPYRKIGDSIYWLGTIRPDIAAEYNIRMLLYNASNAQVGGFVTVALPGE